MTSTIIVESHNNPVLVETIDNDKVTAEVVLWPVDGPVKFYTTTTREIRCKDLNYDHPTALRNPAKEPEPTIFE